MRALYQNNKIRHYVPVFVILVLLCAGVTANGQGSSFTFQGKLNDNGTAANGTYEMQFKLMDNVGTQIGSLVTNSNVTVTNGIFTVRLGFGLLAFNGDPRFLEVSVRPSGSSNAFTTLNPPQSVLSAPYAVRALTAASADLATNAANATNATTAVTATTAVNSTQLGGIAANQYVLTGDSRLSDDRDPLPGSANYIQNTTSAQTTSNFNISGIGRANVFSSTSQYMVGNTRLIGISDTSNIFAGINSGNSTSGTGNAFFGGLSGTNNTTGVNNAFFGFNAGSANNGGGANTFIGVNAGIANVGSSNNTFLGANAGNSNLTGNGNTFLGANSDGGFGLTNSVAIGQKAFVGQSNALILGSINGVNTATADTDVGIGTPNPLARFHVVGDTALIGNVGIGTTNPLSKLWISDTAASSLTVESTSSLGAGIDLRNNFNAAANWRISANASGSGSRLEFTSLNTDTEVLRFTSTGPGIPEINMFSNVTVQGTLLLNDLGASGNNSLCRNSFGYIAFCSSSLRYKKDIMPFTEGLSLIARLRPVSYRWKSDNTDDLGFIAEEVAELEPRLTTTNKDGQIEGVKYDRISAVLVNAVKEQQAQIEAQQKQIEELKAIVCAIKPDAAVCVQEK